MNNFIIQAIGFVALFFVFISFQYNDRKKILGFQVISACLFCAHFFLLGALTGSIMNFLSIARNSVFYNRGKKWANSIVWLFGFIIIFILGGMCTWQGIVSILPIMAMTFSTISLWSKNPKATRLIMLGGSPCWFIYDVINKSIPGIFTEIFVLSSLLIAIFRFDIMKTKIEESCENEY